jgi:hypothetical protein
MHCSIKKIRSTSIACCKYGMTLIFLSCCFIGLAQSNIDQQLWYLCESSNIRIEGSSNVNQFQCQKQSYKGSDYLSLHTAVDKQIFRGKVTLSTAAFECENSMMTKDFMQTLKADVHPHITFDMHELTFSGCSNKTAIGQGVIKIAGESRNIRLTWTIDESKPGEIRLSASRALKFSTFNLVPPRKMMGLIQVHDDITVHFNLVLKQK